MSRVPLPYTQKVLDLFRNPKNLGKLEDANVIAVAGNPACGDMITFYMKINDKDIIEKISFESYGCAANIATASIVTEMVKGLTLEHAWKDVTWKKVTEEVGGLSNEQSENTMSRKARLQAGFPKNQLLRRNRRSKRKNSLKNYQRD
jgi:NifU-like protein involved in Fe-S cluster formation